MGKLDNETNEEKQGCALCMNTEFDVPAEIIHAVKKGDLVIFAGAGISTEGKNVYKSTLYADINDELSESNNNTFPQLMTKYCEKPNGRRKLINKIIDRFDYYKSFPEIDNIMNKFFVPLSDIYSIKEIITTNWDRQFEEKCGCMPIVYNEDISLLDDKKRKVYKIHGSIDNVGTLIITEADYEKCYNNLKENLIGGRIKELLSRKTVVFIGYSLDDEDFKKIWQFIDEKLGSLKPHFYIVSPDEKMVEKLKDKNVTVINTLGSTFVRKIRKQLINDKYLLNSDVLYNIVDIMLPMTFDVHQETNKMLKEKKEPLLIYSICFQDGVIHSLERILARKVYGEYLDPEFFHSSIDTYYMLYEGYVKIGNMFDAAYLFGYAYAMDYILYLYDCLNDNKTINFENSISLYYLPREKIYNDLDEFKKELKKYKTMKYINLANKMLLELRNAEYKFDIHHLPFI